MKRYAAGVVAQCLAVGVGLLASGSAQAAQSSFWQGVAGSPFRLVTPLSPAVVLNGTSDQSLSLRVSESMAIGAGSPGYVSLGVTQPDPRSVEVLANGDVLVADAANHLVAEFSASGALVWSYSAADDSALGTPVCARRLTDGSTLICDETASRVFIVDQSHTMVWQYGQTGVAGQGVDQLDAPTSADVLADGNVAICDAGNHRVIVVRRSDYDATSPSAGFAAGSIVWQYGTTGVAGGGADQLETPTSVQVLTSGASQGNLLICDQGGGVPGAARVLELDATASIVWQFPAAGTSPSVSPLKTPSCALGGFGGDQLVWIADPGSGSVLGVTTGSALGRLTGHAVFADYGPSAGTALSDSLLAPTSLWQPSDGSLMVADPGQHSVVVVGATTGSATVHTVGLDCGLSGRKRFASIRCTFRRVPRAAISVSYSIDGLKLKDLGDFTFSFVPKVGSSSGVQTIAFPPLTVGAKVTLWVTLSTSSRACVPDLKSLAIAFVPWHGSSSGKGGGGASGNRANSNGSASDNPSSAGGGSGSGGGVGGGNGSGSGQGTGSGRGTGSTDTAGSGSSAAGSSAAGAKVPSAVSSSTGSGDASHDVSGYAFKASGRAGGGEGGGVTNASAGVSLASVSGVVAGLLLLLAIGPWAARRRLRLFVDWDPNLPRPFPAERTRDMPRRGPGARVPFGFARFQVTERGHRHR